MGSPSSTSLAFRSRLAQSVSYLRRVRPRVPFFELAVHRAPTLALYRNLLRYSPDDNIRMRVEYLFRKNQHLTGTQKTRRQLLKGYKWLDAFKTAWDGDEKQRVILQRYSRLIAAKVKKEELNRMAREEAAWQARLRSRPILTGTIVKPTFYMRAFPRMKPQPLAISRIIAARIRVRQRRFERMEQMAKDLKYLREEAAFEEEGVQLVGEQHLERVFSGAAAHSWSKPLHDARQHLNALMSRSFARRYEPIPPELVDNARAARREKIANKTRERMRERRGEILPSTLRRARKGPPAHILVRMTPEQKHVDKVVRGVGEVGYVGMVKQRMGVKLRDGGRGLARENGTDLEGEQLRRLQAMEQAYWKDARRRLTAS
ncbi:hypothetical protein FB45DRAFT_845677 [Roridomyces roridus]|uniref:Uncharacterized protein n=1 Tax=Roridomyces roridus TaxID=1738132 RepID=A0AAD7B3W3_9AGAR|nr:hypothetical protein FB45DRAFT_845677 [Roridomyces roridus]